MLWERVLRATTRRAARKTRSHRIDGGFYGLPALTAEADPAAEAVRLPSAPR